MGLQERSEVLAASPQYVSTATAAQMLGLSTTLIQTLVDRQELEGWKTSGGHRRISIESIQAYQSRARMTTALGARTPSLHVLVAMESRPAIARLEKSSHEWDFPVRLSFMPSITEALLALGAERPDLVVVDMAMPRGQQEKTLHALENFNAKDRPVSMVLVTQLHELSQKLKAHSRLIQITPGPLSEVWLHAFLTGVIASCKK